MLLQKLITLSLVCNLYADFIVNFKLILQELPFWLVDGSERLMFCIQSFMIILKRKNFLNKSI